jgi:hypothetical protein
MSGNLCKYNGTDIKQFLFISADSTLNQFFPYTTSEGSLEEVLTTPDKVAVNKRFAHQLFGNHSGIGEILEIINKEGQSKSYKVAAILEDRPQSFLHFDLLTGLSDKSWGGPVLLKLQPGASPLALQEKIKKDKIPALVPDSRYYIDPIKELYFNTGKDSKQQQLAFFQHCDVLLLYISLISALLVLIIACFNYTNLTLSRTLQQLKMIHIEKLMGAKSKEIRSQLFLDAALTVLFAFLLSLLLINDMLPWFNNLLSTRLSFSFFFSRQVLPLLLSFIFLMAVIPGLYISHKLSQQTLSKYRQAYTGKKKQQFIWLLVTIQFIFSIGLVYATTLAQKQMDLIKSRAYHYENTIEIGSGTLPLFPLYQELKQMDGIESISLSMSSVLYCWLRELPIRQTDGSIQHNSIAHIPTDTTFFQTMHIRQIAGVSPSQACREYTHPAFINEKLARLLNIDVSHIGHKLNEFDEFSDSLSTIAGIFKNFPLNSLASIGGFVAADKDTINWLRHNSRSYIFSASNTPAATAAARAALHILKSEPERRENLWKITNYALDCFRQAGFEIGDTESPIIPLYVRDTDKTFEVTKLAFDEGIFINPVIPPACAPQDTLVRVALMATHTKEQVDYAVDKLTKCFKKLEIIK